MTDALGRSYSGITPPPGYQSDPTLNQLRHLAISKALRDRLNWEQQERIERDLEREMRPRGLSHHQKARAYQLRAKGLSYGQIARDVGCEKWQLRFLRVRKD